MGDSADMDLLRRALIAVGGVVGQRPFAIAIGGDTAVITGGNTTQVGQRALLRLVLESFDRGDAKGSVEQLEVKKS